MAFKPRDPDDTNNVKIDSDTAQPVKSTEPTRPRRSRVRSTVGSIAEEKSSEQRPRRNTSKSAKKNTTIVFFAVLCLVVVVVIMVANNSANKQPTQPVPTEQLAPSLSPDEKLKQDLEKEGYGIGAKAGEHNVQVSSDTFVKDLEGNKVPEMFQVAAITNISDFVSYVKHRAVTGDGIELYWLEGRYKGQNCRVVLPYRYFKDLPEEGAVVCSIEIVQTKDGARIATHFAFDAAAYDRLKKK